MAFLSLLKQVRECRASESTAIESTVSESTRKLGACEPGDCYRAAFKMLERLNDLTGSLQQALELVHGYPTGTGGDALGKKYGHAWLEFESRGFRYVLDVFAGQAIVVPAAAYYAVGRIDVSECQRYTMRKAWDMSLQFAHYGPWEKVPKGVVFA